MNASVVAIGDSMEDVLIAAGEVGNGRVVVVTHSAYADNFVYANTTDLSIRTLQKNIKTWATKGAFSNSSNVMDAYTYLKTTNATLRSLVKILFYTESTMDWTETNKTKILNFVKNGGGLFVSVTPWGWSQLKKSKNYNLMLTYKTVLETGITFNDAAIWGADNFYFNKTTYLSHLGIQVDIALSPESTAFDYSKTVEIL